MLAQTELRRLSRPRANPCSEPPIGKRRMLRTWHPPRYSFPLVKDACVMVTTELGPCEWFVWDLRRSNLIDRGQLDQIVGESLQKNPRAEAPALAEFLVAKKMLTQFQSDRVLAGKTQGFVLGPFSLMDAIGSGSMGTVYK